MAEIVPWEFTQGDTPARDIRITPPPETPDPDSWTAQVLEGLAGPGVTWKAQVRESAGAPVRGELIVRAGPQGVRVEIAADVSQALPPRSRAQVQAEWMENGVLKRYSPVTFLLIAHPDVTR